LQVLQTAETAAWLFVVNAFSLGVFAMTKLPEMQKHT